ncbi:hypothetical protein M8J77_012001 [Diaphorina citri]|nr:hypothetical protein M8J77_012001 [Diaphorina citri]
MRGWLTLLVVVTLATSTWCNYYSHSGKEYSGEPSLSISKDQEKILKDFPHAVKHAKKPQADKQSESDFAPPSKDSSSESSASENKKEKVKPNAWQNYARGKYGVEESVDLSILKKKTTRKIIEQPRKPKTKTDKTKKGKDVSGEISDKARQKVTQEHKEKKTMAKKKAESKRKKESESEDKTEEELVIDFSEPEVKKKRGKSSKAESEDVSKLTTKEKKHWKLDSEDDSSSSEYFGKGRRKYTLREFDRGIPEDHELGDPSALITKHSVPGKTEKPNVKKPTVKKAKVKSEPSEDSEDYDSYEDEEIDGRTYETSDHKDKDKHSEPEEPEEYESGHHEEGSASYEEKGSASYHDKDATEETKHTLKSKKAAKKVDTSDSEEHESHDETNKKHKDTITKTNKAKTAKPKKTGKGPKGKDKKVTKKHTTPTVKAKKTQKQSVEDRTESHETYEEDRPAKRETEDPLEMSMEELLRRHKELITTKSPMTTMEHVKPTTLKPAATDYHCPSNVKSETVEINWDNYDSRGEKRKNEKPIVPKFRNKMKTFSTRELKGRLREVGKRGLLKGDKPFDASAALKRVKFNEVFKIKPIDDTDIFRNVTYQPTCSREFEVRMLEKNYRQKYGRRQASAEQQREFENLLKYMGKASKAFSEETCKKIYNEEFEKLLACCDTKEISSIMADISDTVPQKIAYLKKKGKLPLTTSEEVEAMIKAEDPELQKRQRYKEKQRLKQQMKDLEKSRKVADLEDSKRVEMFPGEHKNIDKEYIANTEEVERPLVSPEEEVEETTDPQAITYFPGGRFINTEELEEMKKENEYYERMRKIGGKITRLYDPKNTLSSKEWAALEATTAPPPKWRKPAPGRVTVKGRRKRSAPKESENKRHKRNAEIEENKRPKRQADEEKVSEKITPVGAETEEKHVTTPQGQQVTAVPGQQVTTPAGGQQVTIATTPAHTTVYFDSVFDKWSSISSKASEFFLDNRKQLRKRKSTDKRYNMVMNIFKRHRMKMYNRSDYTYSTITPRSTKGPSTSPRTRVWPRRRVSTVVYDYLTHTEDWSYILDSRNAKKIREATRDYKDFLDHAVAFARRRAGYPPLPGPTPRPRPDWGPTIMRESEVQSDSINPYEFTDSELVELLVRKEEKQKEEKKKARFTEKEEKKAKATWKKLKLHQFFKRYNITKEEWQRMLNPELRTMFNATHQRYTNIKREYFVLPHETWNELANLTLNSEDFEKVNEKNSRFIRICRGQRLNYSARKKGSTSRKPNVTQRKIFDWEYEYYYQQVKKELQTSENSSETEKRNERLRTRTNLTEQDEVYLALKGPIPFDPNFWPSSFLRSKEEFRSILMFPNENVKENKTKRELKEIEKKRLRKQEKQENDYYEKNKSLLRRGKFRSTPPDFWGGYTGIRRKIFEYRRKESAERKQAREARRKAKELRALKIEQRNENKRQRDLEKDLNHTTKSVEFFSTNDVEVTKTEYNHTFEESSRSKVISQESSRSKVISQESSRSKVISEESSRSKVISQESSRSKVISEESSRSKGKVLRKKQRDSVTKKSNKLYDGIKPKNKISRRERAKLRDKKKYGSEYSKIVREKYRPKYDRSYYSRGSRERDYRRYESREKRQPSGRYDQIRGKRREEPKRYVGSRSRESREYEDSRSRERKFRPTTKKKSTKGIRKRRPEKYKKKPDKNKKRRGKRDVATRYTTTKDPIFVESKSEYQGKMSIDQAWLVRRRAYLKEKYARLHREEQERILRKKGKLKEGQTITTKKPESFEDAYDAEQLEQQFLARGLTKRPNISDSMSYFDPDQYEREEREFIKNRNRKQKKRRKKESGESQLESQAKAGLDSSMSVIDVEQYEKEEKKYIEKYGPDSNISHSYFSTNDKDYKYDHNPDYGSLSRMQKLEELLVIDHKRKEGYFKNSPRPKFSKEDKEETIPTWPTKRKNRGVRPQDRKKCFFNPSTTNQYRQVLYVYHKYKQLKEAFDRKENIDEIPSLDSDY